MSKKGKKSALSNHLWVFPTLGLPDLLKPISFGHHNPFSACGNKYA
jgi:hypothetical protein